MGQYTITITGVGAHHNLDYQGDADRLARRLVAELQARGHAILSADFEQAGGARRENLLATPAVPAEEGPEAA